MAQNDTATAQKTCFVVMGFGTKTDFESTPTRVLNLDASYHGMIRPAVEDAGLKCIRADEMVFSGLIDVPMYEMLLSADVVVADLSTSNKNAFYELGVRHALRPSTTIIIAEDGAKTFPFDINHVVVRQYHHLGEDIGVGEAKRFQALLTDAIQQILAKDPTDNDSPVYTFLKDLTPPALKKMQQEALTAMVGAPPPAPKAEDAGTQTYSVLMKQAHDARKGKDWPKMQMLLDIVRTTQKQARAQERLAATVVNTIQADREDPYLLQQLALATYKSKQPTEQAALLAARDVLAPLEPALTNDTETLGLWGSIHKRLWELAKHPADNAPTNSPASAPFLDEAIRAYERGYYLRNDHYNGINFAFLLNARAAEAATPVAEAIADYVQAQRVRREVITLCDQWLAAQAAAEPTAGSQSEEEQQKEAGRRYWVMASQGEAYLGLGEDEKAKQLLEQARALASEPWMQDSTEEQLNKLRGLLAANPLQFIASTSQA